eukprot:175532-Rhodomonas_salina.1
MLSSFSRHEGLGRLAQSCRTAIPFRAFTSSVYCTLITGSFVSSTCPTYGEMTDLRPLNAMM